VSATTWLRRHRGTAVLLLTIPLVLVALSVLSARTSVRGEPLDPDNPSPSGAQAVARVVARHGLALSVVRRAAALARARVDENTTVLVTSTQNLGRATSRQVAERTTRAGALVLARPGPTLIEALHLPLSTAAADVRRPAASGCDDPLLRDLSVDVGPSTGYRARGPVATSCFRGSGADAGALVVRVGRGSPTYAVGGTDLFTNDRVDRADNAAAALRLLGQQDRLLWYVPDSRDVAAGDSGSFAAQLPGGLVPSLWLLAAATLATMIWRGRRLGPLVVEPLPVVIKAVESTQGRGRLYRRVRDSPHAATALRRATSRRLADRLRLPPGIGAAGVADAVARAIGADPRRVHEVLVTRPVGDDRALVRLAADLTALEEEVHDR
jgi:hypothetical protein